MANVSSLILTQVDYQKLSSLVKSAPSEVAELLEEELSRSSVVAPESLPGDVVTMNSQVSFVDVDTSKETVVTLVYPHEADMAENKVSVLAPVGSALIGLRAGQVIDWPMPQGRMKRLKVVSVLFQPEALSA